MSTNLQRDPISFLYPTPEPNRVGRLRVSELHELYWEESGNPKGAPVLFLHGDTHRFRVDRPLHGRDGRVAENFTRVECFGFPFTASWVRIGYDPADPNRFVVGTRELRASPR